MINFEDNDVRQFKPRSLLQWLAKCINKQDKYIEANAVKGDKGDKGDTVVSVQIGNTTTGEAGTNASVTNVGTDTEAILDFTIPKGDKGDKGDTGATGERGEKGEQGLAASIAIGTVTSVDNSQPAKVTNSGTAENAILNFEIPKGQDGTSYKYEWQNNYGENIGAYIEGDISFKYNEKEFSCKYTCFIPTNMDAIYYTTIAYDDELNTIVCMLKISYSYENGNFNHKCSQCIINTSPATVIQEGDISVTPFITKILKNV